MSKINLIKPDTNLTGLTNPMGWDLVIGGRPYDVYYVEGFIHSYGGKHGDNCFWACPSIELPSFYNLIPFAGHAPEWGIAFTHKNHVRFNWGQNEVREGSECWITRNGKRFIAVPGFDMGYAVAKAQTMITELTEGPAEVNQRDWKDKLVGRKVFYREQPAIIEWVSEGNELWIVPDNEPNRFALHPAQADEDRDDMPENDDSGEGVMISLLSPQLYWFRD